MSSLAALDAATSAPASLDPPAGARHPDRAMPHRGRRQAFTGTLPQPVVRLQLPGDHYVALELYRSRAVDVVAQGRDHLLSLLVSDLPHLVQQREGTTCERAMSAGEVIVTPAGSPKRWCHEHAVEYVALRFAPGLLHELIASESTVSPGELRLVDQFGVRDPHLERTCRRLCAEVQGAAVGSALYAQALVVQLGVHLVRHYCGRRQVDAKPRPGLPAHKLRRTTEFIEAHLREDLTLERLAAELAMSPYHFAHAFKQAAGIPPHQFLLQRRMARAMHLLRTTEAPVTEIAHQVGFSNPSHFAVAFGRTTGQSPRQFRKMR